MLELSSFQLMTLCDGPEAVAITNVSPNHLDWHTDEEEYARAKYNIVGKRTKRVVLNADFKRTYEFGLELLRQGGREIIFFSSAKTPRDIPSGACLTYLDGDTVSFFDGKETTPVLERKDILLPGRHNIENYMTAISLTFGLVDPSVYRETAMSFGGVEHRLELVRRLDGIDYYNSSIDSSPTRTAAALSALGERDIIIICGGYDKKIPYAPLAEHLFAHARAVVLTGATAPKIDLAMTEYAEGHKDIPMPRREHASDFRTAVDKARLLACELGKNNPCVLLSPASASFDSFKNFAERGNYFKDIVNQL